MRSRPGAQHQSAECSIASCVVLVSGAGEDLVGEGGAAEGGRGGERFAGFRCGGVGGGG